MVQTEEKYARVGPIYYLSVTSGEIVIMVFTGFVSATLVILFRTRLNRLEDKLDALIDKLDDRPGTDYQA